MLFFILMPALLLVALPLLLIPLGTCAALWAKKFAARQASRHVYPTAEVLEATFEAEPENAWPPKPTVEPPGML